jgi:hypothetical protein
MSISSLKVPMQGGEKWLPGPLGGYSQCGVQFMLIAVDEVDPVTLKQPDQPQCVP